MTYIPRSSFIPGETPGAIPRAVQKRRTIRIFSVLSSTMLIAAVGVSGFLYFYTSVTNKNLEEAKAAFAAEQVASGVDAKATDLQSFNKKLTQAENLLSRHLSPSRMFTQLEMLTKQTVQFDSLTYEYTPGQDAYIEVGGRTAELMSVAVQNDQLTKERLFNQYVLQGIALNASSEGQAAEAQSATLPIGFTIKGVLNTKEILFTGDLIAITETENPVVSTTENPPENQVSIDSDQDNLNL
jgi:hypothetical protein